MLMKPINEVLTKTRGNVVIQQSSTALQTRQQGYANFAGYLKAN